MVKASPSTKRDRGGCQHPYEAEGKLEAWPEAELAIFALICAGSGEEQAIGRQSFKGGGLQLRKRSAGFAIPSDSQQEVNRVRPCRLRDTSIVCAFDPHIGSSDHQLSPCSRRKQEEARWALEAGFL